MGLIRCVGCGKFINDTSEKCKYCGCRFESNEIKPKLTKEQKRKRFIIIVSILVFIVVLWVILSLILNQKREITCTYNKDANKNYKITYKMAGPRIVKMIGYQYEKIDDIKDRKKRWDELVDTQDSFINDDTSTYYIKKDDNEAIILNYSLDVSENLNTLKTLHELIEIDNIEVNTKIDDIKKIYENKGFLCK